MVLNKVEEISVMNKKELQKWMDDNLQPCKSLNRKMSKDSD